MAGFNNNTVRLSYGPEEFHFGELHLPVTAGPHPLAMLIHGGFWRVPYDYTLMTGLANDLASRSIAAWNIEYRRIGDPHGGWPNTFLDVANAADFVRSIAATYHLDLQRVVPIGHSAGGHLALWLAARPRIPQGYVLAQASTQENERVPLAILGAISLAGVSDLLMGWQRKLGNGAVAELIGGSPTAMPERYATASPAALLPPGVPQVLVHGTADDRVPYDMSEAYTAQAQAAGDDVQLITLPQVDHFALIDPTSQAWAATVNALQALLHAR
ncbi:MAG TPA: alpha/beta hydrolase [Ktedonobacteraceae bacterium]|nr:alpha/beta hydrolase [Ktedonobacteraceae bacterium]